MPNITLPDGSQRQFDGPVTGAEIAGDIGPGLAKAAMAVVVDGAEWDLTRPIEVDAQVAIITERDEAALEQVARAWYARIRSWAILEVGDPALAEDVVQEALLRLMNSIHRYDPDRPLGPWLRTIVRNCARTEGGRQRRHAHDALAESHLTVVPRPEHALDTERAAEQAVALFGQLSGRQREVMHLCTRDGLTAAEAADVMGVAPSTARCAGRTSAARSSARCRPSAWRSSRPTTSGIRSTALPPATRSSRLAPSAHQRRSHWTSPTSSRRGT